MNKGLVILAAGGTGGHLFPAQALAEVLVARGYNVHLMTDERVRDYGKDFPASETHLIPSASPSLSKPMQLPRRGMKLLRGFLKARSLMKKLKPVAVVGFGGYPSFPPLFAARSLKIPTVIHEANAVLGRANKVLASRVNVVATSFQKTTLLPDGVKVVVTGNPPRAIVLKQKAATYIAAKANDVFNLVVFGGSQGAKFFSDFMPDVFAVMPAAQRKRLHLTQQCRAEDVPAVQARLAALNIDAEISPFFANMPKLIVASQLVICRSGATTVAELSVIGRPAVFVPLPHAIDNDQLRNAQNFAGAGGGWVFPQGELKAPEFATFLMQLMANGAILKKAAADALAQGVPDAPNRLADVVEGLVGKNRAGVKK
ncbi:MAG: undecaprenyldiphospho-muramoylpentapeptide beta-N-acetylglucosaminyltransferase [Pseudomonadota bacterium]|nr:undecaprenyldiphospho-muramoylpentapeptide beta-N-acetylglucosaminyltransferase [Pseudomonadota bacterium]